MDDDSFYTDYEFPEPEPEPYWTVKRVIFIILVLITLLSFIAYAVFGNWVSVSVPTPPPATMPVFLT